MWKVIIADDEKLICRLIEALVDWEKLNMRIAGKAENGLEALQMVRELRPHLLITDIRMPGCDGLDLDGGELGGPARSIIRRKAEELFQTTVLPVCAEGALYLRDFCGYGLLSYPDGDRDRPRHALRELLSKLEANKSLFGQVVFTIGLGRPVRRARELGESVATARLAADERLIEGRGRKRPPPPTSPGRPC